MRRVQELDALGAGVELLKVEVGISTVEKCWSFEFFVANFFKKRVEGRQGLQPKDRTLQARRPHRRWQPADAACRRNP